jgi:hypothetical protein
MVAKRQPHREERPPPNALHSIPGACSVSISGVRGPARMSAGIVQLYALLHYESTIKSMS